MLEKELTEVCRFLSETPKNIRLMTESLTAEKERLKPVDDNFSILEHICHLRDIEEKGYRVRIEKILNENDPFLPDIDGNRLAREREYQKQNLIDELKAFSDFRAKNISALRKTSPEDFQKTGRLENVGRITLDKLLLIMLEHDEEHLQTLCDLCNETGKN